MPQLTTLETRPNRSVYDLVVAAFVGMLLISNIGATKLIAFGPDWSVGGAQLLPILTDGGAILFPLTYILGTSWRRSTDCAEPTAPSSPASCWPR